MRCLCVLQQRSGSLTSTAGKGIASVCCHGVSVCYNRDKASRPAWPARCLCVLQQRSGSLTSTAGKGIDRFTSSVSPCGCCLERGCGCNDREWHLSSPVVPTVSTQDCTLPLKRTPHPALLNKA